MFATLLLAALPAPVAPPAPLPDRWLLKLVPKNLPPLPERFYTQTWYGTSGQRILPSWELWAEFNKLGKGRPAEAVLTHTGSEPTGFGGGLMLEHLPPRGHRTIPLAVHGPLVEFNRKLYTATIRTVGPDPPKRRTDREMLYLGSAIEVKERVWYQAGTIYDKRLTVEEWRIDFKEDPRTADRGTATVRGHWRELTEPEGESFDAEVRFRAGTKSTGGRTVQLLWPSGIRQTHSMPRLEIDDTSGGFNFMYLGGYAMHTLALYPSPKQRPKVIPETIGLVQPPTKQAGK